MTDPGLSVGFGIGYRWTVLEVCSYDITVLNPETGRENTVSYPSWANTDWFDGTASGMLFEMYVRYAF
jgi:hypothetical protein